jgi:hypothetical protein
MRADLQELFTVARERIAAVTTAVDAIESAVGDLPAPAGTPMQEWLDRNPLLRWRWRHRPPLSRRRAARLLDVSPPALRSWETGARMPNDTSFREIERATGITRPEYERWLAQRPGE